MLKRSPLFRPVLEHNPKFEQVYRYLIHSDRFANFSFERSLQYDFHQTRVLLKRDPNTGKDTSQLMLFPMRVTEPAINVFGTLHGGMLMTMIDMCTSFHIAERLLPKMNGHVSVNMQTNFVTAAKQGDDIVAVCRVDKLGKRLAYTSVEFYLDSQNAKDSATLAETPEAVEAMLREYTTIANGKHVKSILANVDLA